MIKSWAMYVVLLVVFAIMNRIKPGFISSLGFFVILLTPLISFLHISLSYYSFKLTHDVNRRHVSKGENISYTIKLINPTVILLAPFFIHYFASDKLFNELKTEEKHQIIIAPRKKIIIRKTLKCYYRGNYSIGVDKIILQDFFGFFRFKYSEIEQHKILVYPKLRELKSNLLHNVVNESSESVITNDTQNQSVFSDIREYIPGDSLNRIHWKLSAKEGEWLTKDYSGQMTNKTKLFLDTYSLSLDEEERIIYEDYLVEGCVAIMHFLLENRIHTELYYEHFGIHKFEGNSIKNFPVVYETLANVSFYREEKLLKTLNDVLKNEHDTCHIVVITQRIDIKLAELLVKLKYRNFEISVVSGDSRMIEVADLAKHLDSQSQIMLTMSKIPIYHMQHDESATRLGVL